MNLKELRSLPNRVVEDLRVITQIRQNLDVAAAEAAAEEAKNVRPS